MTSSTKAYQDGTRFRLFAHPPHLGERAGLETVTVSSPAGSLRPGPSDHRMYAIHPIGKDMPYGIVAGDHPGSLYLPPWNGPMRAPAKPGPDGHFDHLQPGDPGFEAAHLFGAVRFTLDVWETYLGEEVPWHFARDYARLELSMIDNWANAHMGYGYIETGARLVDGELVHYALNFDIIAHEIGHAILVAMTGPFVPGTVPGEFEAFHEVSSDWVALIASLHFDGVIEALLRNTSGNLDTFNRFSRFGEYSPTAQIRLANNNQTMAHYARGWKDEHHLAKPLIGALFDIFVDIYHEILLDFGAVPPALEELADQAEREPALLKDVQHGFDRAYDREPAAFRKALEIARDLMAGHIIAIWESIEKETFSYADLPALVERIDMEKNDGRLRRLIRNSFAWRQIGSIHPGPRLILPTDGSHSHSARMIEPA